MSGGRRIPIIGDEYVDREFGTGALKITPGQGFWGDGWAGNAWTRGAGALWGDGPAEQRACW